MTTSTSSPQPTPEQPCDLENALSHLQCVLVAQRTRTNPEGVTWTQYDILELLRIRGPMTPSALSVSLGSSRPSVSKALRTLKDRHLIRQQAAGEDRREQLTSLTEGGLQFLTRAAHSRRENAAVAVEALSPGEQAMFAELCHKVAAALEQRFL
ncbi:MarR family winged helix-turn-helix transcriptional regulator [Longimycelium tulufanense]|nr:MarR family transcriptional regulator [Longimycelium tulufanense]